MTIPRKSHPIIPITALILPTLVILLGISLSNQDKIISFNTLKTASSRSIRSFGSKDNFYQNIKWIFNPASIRESSSIMDNQIRKGDVYFLSHGGPSTVEQYHSSPYKAWQKFGKMINDIPPKGIVVVSAHWENDSGFMGTGNVVVNSNPSNPLIYDFYNFPKRLYELKFASSFNDELESSVHNALKEGGISFSKQDRGLDHGVWFPFKAAFGESTSIPIIQVSLPGSSDPRASIKLGQALSKIRDDGYAVITTGQPVHNLRDLFTGREIPYTKPFLTQLDNSLNSTDPKSSTIDLLKSPLYKHAHPTDEHFFPLFVALGALTKEEEKKKQDIFVGVVDAAGNPAVDEGLGWAMWRWSSV